MTRNLLRLLAVLLTTFSPLSVSPPARAASYLGIPWGSLPRTASSADTEMLHDVRAGQHACFDRLVLDFNGGDTTFRSYDVRYVSQITNPGSGFVVPVRGAADLQITVRAPAYDEYGNPTYTFRNRNEI